MSVIKLQLTESTIYKLRSSWTKLLFCEAIKTYNSDYNSWMEIQNQIILESYQQFFIPKPNVENFLNENSSTTF